MRRFKGPKIFLIILLVAAGITLFTFIVMTLWNAILPAVLHVGAITFWQALGILILCKLLFGGFHGGRGRGWGNKGHQWRQRMSQKWESMTPEEREKFKQHLKDRCGPPWRNRWMEKEDKPSTPSTPGEAGTD